MNKKLRILLTKPTHDSHDRGVRLLARRFQQAGFEVIFTSFLLADEVAQTAVQEAVDAIGVSCSSGGHMVIFDDLLGSLDRANARDILVIAGGVIPAADARELSERGVHVFGPTRSPAEAVAFVVERCAPR